MWFSLHGEIISITVHSLSSHWPISWNSGTFRGNMNSWNESTKMPRLVQIRVVHPTKFRKIRLSVSRAVTHTKIDIWFSSLSKNCGKLDQIHTHGEQTKINPSWGRNCSQLPCPKRTLDPFSIQSLSSLLLLDFSI